MAILEIKKIKISLLEFLIFVKKTDIFVLISKAKKKAVTVGLEIGVSNPTTKRYFHRVTISSATTFYNNFVTLK